MNKAMITGRWTGEPKVSSTQDGLMIARGNIAIDRKGKDKGADFPSVVAFGKTAEHIQKYHHKGTKAEIVGRIQTGSYEGKNGKVYTTEIVIEEIGFAESLSSQKKEEPKEEEFVNVTDTDELPFN